MDNEIVLKIKEQSRQKVLNTPTTLEKKITKIGGAIREKTLTAQDIKFTRLSGRILEMTAGKDYLNETTIYNEYRLSSWLPMPTEDKIGNNEIYMLFHVPKDASSILSFKVTTQKGAQYRVTYGKMEDGNFVPVGGTYVNSGEKYDNIFTSTNNDTTTLNGMNQIMFKVDINDSSDNIVGFETTTSAYRTSPGNFKSWNIVEISAKLPYVSTININSKQSNQKYGGLNKLKFFSMYGTNNLTNFEKMFYNLSSLVSVRALDISKGTSFKNMFENCKSLMNVCELNLTGKSVSCDKMFLNCKSLLKVPVKNVESLTSISQMFAYCNNLSNMSNLKFNSITSAYRSFFNTGLKAISNCTFSVLDCGMFSECSNLVKFENCVFSSTKDLTDAFSGCSALMEAPVLKPDSNNPSIEWTNTFARCSRLKTVTIDLNNCLTDLYGTFSDCKALQKVVILNGTKIKQLYNTFSNCNSLIAIDGLDTTSLESANSTFKGCRCISKIENFNISKLTSSSSLFKECYCLNSLTFIPSQTLKLSPSSNINLDLSECGFGREAIVKLFESLPTKQAENTGNYTIILTNNRGVITLSATDKAIASNKGWVVTY